MNGIKIQKFLLIVYNCHCYYYKPLVGNESIKVLYYSTYIYKCNVVNGMNLHKLAEDEILQYLRILPLGSLCLYTVLLF